MSKADETYNLLAKINTGKTADVVYGHLAPVFRELEAATLNQLKSDFRAGKFDPVAFQCKIAELCAYENLEIKLKAQINKGTHALEKTHGNGDK